MRTHKPEPTGPAIGAGGPLCDQILNLLSPAGAQIRLKTAIEK